jgi:ABC-type lipoprotein release transport system permease subunit
MFKLTLKMAWHNLWRRVRRSVLVIIMIAFSMTAMLSIEGLYDGMVKTMRESTIRSDSGEISVFAPKFRLYRNLEYVIKDDRKLLGVLKADPDVKAVAVRVAQTGLASTAHKSSMARLVGIDLGAEEAFGQLSAFVKEGKIDWGRRRNGCAVGKKLAEDLGVAVGHRLVFSSQNVQGDISSVSLYVTAILQTSNLTIDNQTIFIALPRSRAFSGLGADGATQVALRLKNPAAVDAEAAKLKAAFPRLDVETWQQLYPVLKQMQEMMVIFNSITFAIVMLVVLIGIFGVMLVSILERTREFGILIALGTPQKQLRVQVALESLVLGVLGYAFGALMSYAALWYLQRYGLDLREYAAGLEAFGYNAVIYADIKLRYFTNTFLAIVAAALVSVLLPMYRLKKLNPIEVIQA